MNPYKNYKNRDLYLNKLIAFKDNEAIKVVTGIGRCGKSSLLKLMINYLLENGVGSDQILEMNFESFEFVNMTADAFNAYVKKRCIPTKRMYLFFDELQRVRGWENAVNAFRVDLNCDIYITGSNSYLLSSEYSTYLSGRCVEIKMLPLSFSEFISFHNFKVVETKDMLGIRRKYLIDKNKVRYEIRDAFETYLKFGGMPGIVETGFNQEKIHMILDGIYSTVIVRDILEREKRKNQSKITDSVLLKKITMFLADNIGNNVSIHSIGNTLMNEGLMGDERKSAPSTHTVQLYVDALLESYIFYEIKRFDIKGKEFLRTLGKYYIVDIGLRNYLLGYRNRDIGHILENVVYFELIKRGYDVAIGKADKLEIDFIASNTNEKIYLQVTETMMSEDVRKRELTPLEKIQDNHEKIVLSLDPGFETSFNGIKSLNIMDWLLQ